MDCFLSSSFQACNFLVHFAFKIPVRTFRSDVEDILKVVVGQNPASQEGKRYQFLGASLLIFCDDGLN